MRFAFLDEGERGHASDGAIGKTHIGTRRRLRRLAHDEKQSGGEGVSPAGSTGSTGREGERRKAI